VEEYTVQLIDLSKVFARGYKREVLVAIDHINLEVKRGEILGLLGPNGAGKTTLLKMICGLLRPTEGEIIIYGQPLQRYRSEILARIGAVLEGSRNSLWSMTVKQNLRYFGCLKNVHGEVLQRRSAELLRLFQLREKDNELVKNLSKGMKQRLAIALAFINDPELVFLDEPTLGLDIQTARLVKTLILKLAKEKNRTLILSTHNMAIVEDICDRVAIINKGRLIALDETAALFKGVEQESYIIRLKGEVDLQAIQIIPEVSNVEILETLGQKECLVKVIMNDANSLFQIIEALRRGNIRVLSLSKCEPSLEDIFVKMLES